MKSVLCIDWGAHGIGAAAESLAALGYAPTVAGIAWDDIVNNPSFAEALAGLLHPEGEDPPVFVFTHNFFPQISDVCQAEEIPYLSLVFDSPHMTLTSRAADNPVNHIWLFDRGLLDYLEKRGFKRLHHTVLPADPGKSAQAARSDVAGDSSSGSRYEHEVCFLGSLYQGEYVYYDQISYLPPGLKGCLDGVIRAQQQIFGYDMIGDEAVLPEEQIDQMREYVHFDIRGDYHPDESLLLRDMLRKKVTSLERARILARLAEKYNIDVYTTPSSRVPDGVRNLGYADYNTQMPQVFYRSRINLNISLRTIRTGIPLRVMDILSSGGFLISDWREELAEFFEDGEELVLCRTVREMEEQIAWYLAHDEERERIAANGQRAALERFGTDIVFGRMIEEIKRGS